VLDARQIRHTFRPSEGAHAFKVWRPYLSEFAPLLFRKGGAGGVPWVRLRVSYRRSLTNS
jgi:hypothetical protein